MELVNDNSCLLTDIEVKSVLSIVRKIDINQHILSQHIIYLIIAHRLVRYEAFRVGPNKPQLRRTLPRSSSFYVGCGLGAEHTVTPLTFVMCEIWISWGMQR